MHDDGAVMVRTARLGQKKTSIKSLQNVGLMMAILVTD